MPIVVDYQADPTLQALASARGSAAPVAAEQDWRERQLAEQQYQFDQEYDWRIQQAALQDRMARYESGNRMAIAGAQIQSNNYNNQLDYDLGQRELGQRSEQFGVEAALQADQQQQLTNRAQMSQLGQIARQQQEQRFEAAMADRKASEDWMRTASPRQQQQFRQQWEQKHGLGWTAPEEAMAQQDAEFEQAQRAKISGMLQAPDGSGQLMAPESVVDALMDLEPDKRIDAWNKIHDTWTRRQKDLLSTKSHEIEQQKFDADRERDDALARQQFEHTQKANEQQMAQAEKLHKQKLIQTARSNYQKARSEWIKAQADPLATPESKKALGEEPKLEEYLTDDLLGTNDPPAWYLALPPGSPYTAPDGTQKIKGN